jgi:preprotein translocase subunit YajC
MLNLLQMFAQTTPPGTAGTQAQPNFIEQNFVLLIPLVGFALVYFLWMRPAQKERRDREAMLNKMDKNDEVILTSGIYGTIIGVSEAKDKDEITVKISDNTRIRVVKSAIAKNLTKEEAFKAQQAAGKTTTPKPEEKT